MGGKPVTDWFDGYETIERMDRARGKTIDLLLESVSLRVD